MYNVVKTQWKHVLGTRIGLGLTMLVIWMTQFPYVSSLMKGGWLVCSRCGSRPSLSAWLWMRLCQVSPLNVFVLDTFTTIDSLVLRSNLLKLHQHILFYENTLWSSLYRSGLSRTGGGGEAPAFHPEDPGSIPVWIPRTFATRSGRDRALEDTWNRWVQG